MVKNRHHMKCSYVTSTIYSNDVGPYDHPKHITGWVMHGVGTSQLLCLVIIMLCYNATYQHYVHARI